MLRFRFPGACSVLWACACVRAAFKSPARLASVHLSPKSSTPKLAPLALATRSFFIDTSNLCLAVSWLESTEICGLVTGMLGAVPRGKASLQLCQVLAKQRWEVRSQLTAAVGEKSFEAIELSRLDVGQQVLQGVGVEGVHRLADNFLPEHVLGLRAAAELAEQVY